MKYAVTVVRTGTIWVEAATPADAMQIVRIQKPSIGAMNGP